MKKYLGFLRGINVGGNIIVPMKDLASLCTKAGLKNVRTYINSGNILFESTETEAKLETLLEKTLLKKFGKDIKVVIREVKELEKIVKKNPFSKSNPSQVIVLLMKTVVSKSLIKEFEITGREEIKIGTREVYVDYKDGMGQSKLKWPASLKGGTMRNINTFTKLLSISK